MNSRYLKIWLFVFVVFALVSADIRGFSFLEKEQVEARSISFLEKLIYEKVNEERLKHSLLGVQWASDVAEVARKHSQDMAIKGYFAHENKEKETVSERLTKAGIAFTVSAENLFKCENYPDIVEESVQGWMQSSGHRENILNDKVEETGVGIYKVDGKNEYYVTQNFIKRALKFVPAPSKLSDEEISEIFNIIKDAITGPDYRNVPLKERIVKKLINSNIAVKRGVTVEGFLRGYPEVKMAVDLVASDGFIIDFTRRAFEDEKETFSRLVTLHGYSAVVLIQVTKKKVEYVLIRAGQSE